MNDLLSMLGQLHSAGRLTPEEEETYYRLRDLKVDRVDLVRQGANGRRRFAVVKGTEDMSTQPELDSGLGVEVVPDGAGGFVVLDPVEKQMALPGPVKDALLKRFTEAQEKMASLINMIKGASSAPPNAPIPAEIGREAKAIADHISGSAARYPSPKTASPGGEEKPMQKEAEAAVVELDGTTYDLTEIAKAGAKLNAANRKRLDSALKEIQAVIREETDPTYAALAKEARENAERLERIEAMLAKAFGADDKPAAPEAQPAAEPEQAPVAKDATPAAQPAPVQPVAGSQAAQPTPVQPVAKADDDLFDKSHYLGDLNAVDDDEDLDD